jgi:hypothetical protein
MRAPTNGLDQRRHLPGRGAGFGWLVGQFYFNEYSETSGASVGVESARKFGRIHRMNDLEDFRAFLGFVGLQMPDEVVASVRATAQFGSFLIKFLDVILSEIPQAELVSFANHDGWKFLGHRDQLNFGTVAMGARRRIRDAGFDLI